MLYDTPPDMSDGGFEFSPSLSEIANTYSGESVHVLGSRINPQLADDIEVSSVEDSYVCEPTYLDDYVTGNVVAITNPFYEFELTSDELPMYVVTTPYKIRDLDHHKYKMMPLNPKANYVRVHGEKEETEATLLTGTGRAEPANVYPVPDVLIADACGFSEEIISRRI